MKAFARELACDFKADALFAAVTTATRGLCVMGQCQPEAKRDQCREKQRNRRVHWMKRITTSPPVMEDAMQRCGGGMRAFGGDELATTEALQRGLHGAPG